MRKVTLDNSTVASDPGGIRVSHAKVRRFHPELYPVSPLSRFLRRLSPNMQLWQIRIEEHLQYGDSRAALVMAVAPLLVAAYTDELDWIAMLTFPVELVQEYGLQVGTRLLTVNLYERGRGAVADLEHGPASYHRYRNFSPYIAEFLSEDLARIEQRKSEISEAEWMRTQELGQLYLAKHGPRARDGRPLRCHIPAWN